ncbi:hypothetical protein [Streptomyces sp. MK7]|uniref:hypothetical protein n=1 Tax=Streptomyces sp. MK7 TaxID=3067635 RepID=UPI00292F3FE6|nr:hypothetical protein [Streptomyces sp. MK7]
MLTELKQEVNVPELGVTRSLDDSVQAVRQNSQPRCVLDAKRTNGTADPRQVAAQRLNNRCRTGVSAFLDTLRDHSQGRTPCSGVQISHRLAKAPQRTV